MYFGRILLVRGSYKPLTPTPPLTDQALKGILGELEEVEKLEDYKAARCNSAELSDLLLR